MILRPPTQSGVFFPMIKYVPQLTSVVLEEIPDRVTLAVEISHCRGNCPGCHSPFLKEDIGEELTPAIIDALVRDNFGVDCFLSSERDETLGPCAAWRTMCVPWDLRRPCSAVVRRWMMRSGRLSIM